MECSFLQANEKELVSSLEEVFGKGNVEVHEEGASLIGYHGDDRSKLEENSRDYAPPCHIVVRRKNVGTAANDIGYRRNSEGGYTAYISDYDRRSTFTQKKRDQVKQSYAVSVTEKQLQRKGYTVSKRVEGKKVVLEVKKW